MTEQTVEQLLEQEYGLSGSLQRLGGENKNLLVELPDGGRVVLKVLTEGGPEVHELEHAACEALHDAGLGLGLPRTIPGRQGEIWVHSAEGPARLMEHVPGRTWAELGEPSAALCRDLGRVLVGVDRALTEAAPPGARRTHHWDPGAVLDHRAKVALIEEADLRGQVEEAFRLFAAGARPLLPDLPGGFLHADPNEGNLLVDPEADRLCGLIDFGDCTAGALVAELAIACAYLMQTSSAPLERGADLVAGYWQERPLTGAECEALVPLLAGRLAVTLSTCAERRRIDSTREGWFVSEESSRRLLGLLLDLGPQALLERLLAGVEAPAEVARWSSGDSPTDLVRRRSASVNPALSIAYEDPLKIVRGRGAYLLDHRGRPYLDLVNNVCHVGHCHPHVVEAGQRQLTRLNTNTRYLHDGLVDYAERLTATLPDGLDVCFLVNSGSEANELALRLARQHTGREDMLVVEGAYHGHTSNLIHLSPYKFLGRGGKGAPEPWVHMVPLADGYRGIHRGHDLEAGRAYGDEVGRVLGEAQKPVAGFLVESLLSCGGQVVPPPGYLPRALEHVRAAGGVGILDEVQVGFGRVGSHFWAFELQGVVPDIVVMGKPIGNGHPMAAVVTTREVADSFAGGMEYFATFGGNPVSCAIGMAVLDVIEEEGLQARAHDLGQHFLEGLRQLEQRHELVGDARGVGLFLGLELVRDRETLEPATGEAAALVERMRARGVLLSTDGPHSNVLKIKPPLVLDRGDIDMALRLLDEELAGLGSQRST